MIIEDRRDFGKLCQHLGYKRGVEIGTDRADFAATILRDWTGCEEFRCIDPYEPYGLPPHGHQYKRDADLIMACVRLAPFVPAVRIHQMRSTEAPKHLWFAPEFVYIDGAHDYISVSADIETWWPLVVSGGMLAGHDYSESTKDVRHAVDALVAREKLVLFTTHEPRFPRSWWVYKP